MSASFVWPSPGPSAKLPTRPAFVLQPEPSGSRRTLRCQDGFSGSSSLRTNGRSRVLGGQVAVQESVSNGSGAEIRWLQIRSAGLLRLPAPRSTGRAPPSLFDISSQMPSCGAASQLRSEAATRALLPPWLTVDPLLPVANDSYVARRYASASTRPGLPVAWRTCTGTTFGTHTAPGSLRAAIR